jgi:hypothetical protein
VIAACSYASGGKPFGRSDKQAGDVDGDGQPDALARAEGQLAHIGVRPFAFGSTYHLSLLSAGCYL